MYIVECVMHDGRGKRSASAMFGPVATFQLAQALADEKTDANHFCKLYALNIPRKAYLLPELKMFAPDHLEPLNFEGQKISKVDKS